MSVFEISYAYRPVAVSPCPVGAYSTSKTIVIAENMNEAAYEFFTDLKLDRMTLNDVNIVELNAAFIQAPVFDGVNAVGEKANHARDRATRSET